MEEKKETFKSGEKGFAVFWLLIGAFFFYQSWLMYRESPSAESHGAVPLFVSGLIVVFSIIILVIDRNKVSENHGRSVGAMLKDTLEKTLPKDIVITLLMLLFYCIGLLEGLGFYIATPVFLWAAMSYLMRKDYLKNLLWTALCVGFIFAVFSTLFKVVLP